MMTLEKCRKVVLMMLIVLMSQFQVVRADSGDVFATMLAYVKISLQLKKNRENDVATTFFGIF